MPANKKTAGTVMSSGPRDRCWLRFVRLGNSGTPLVVLAM